MYKEEKNYNNILFGYMCVPACGDFKEDDGGFSIAVYENGMLIHKTYIFDGIEKTKTEYKISVASVNVIKMIMKEHQEDINTFNKHLDNGSLDGVGNFFIFNGKQFITWNIEYTDEKKLKKNNLNYYIKYNSVISQENKMLLIFNKVTKILKSQGVNLKICEVNFRKRLD